MELDIARQFSSGCKEAEFMGYIDACRYERSPLGLRVVSQGLALIDIVLVTAKIYPVKAQFGTSPSTSTTDNSSPPPPTTTMPEGQHRYVFINS